MKKLNHLSEIYKSYDCFIIDLWGVMHDGIKLYNEAVNAVDNLTKENKRIVFLSNAPRPNINVINFLKKLKLDDKYLKNILTSGEAALKSLKRNKFGKKFYHLGPQRDQSLFNNLEKNKVSINECEYILCTGLFDDKINDLNFYSNLLKDHINKKFICTNPDLIVHRGNTEEYCAGTIAALFEKMGGKVIYFGKPHLEVYKMCLKENEKSLIIGDNLRTDIKGANNLNLDSIFITNGVHRSEYKSEKDLISLLKKYSVEAKYFQSNLIW
ncbi:TIGR01459 family HAD-type hydrolase [Pelagibacteraceae bacterium]|nr:TIGR01459 family HAD-type hydrolase [Pelagibacteraceae bacterium]